MDHFNSDVPEDTFDQLTKSQHEVLDKAAPSHVATRRGNSRYVISTSKTDTYRSVNSVSCLLFGSASPPWSIS